MADTGYEFAVEQAYATWRAARNAISAEFASEYDALLAKRQRAEEQARLEREVEIDAAMHAAWMADNGEDTYGYDDD